ncbi:hypothetical protein DAPPUDRAFT_119052, partial [Daphnia pulex]
MRSIFIYTKRQSDDIADIKKRTYSQTQQTGVTEQALMSAIVRANEITNKRHTQATNNERLTQSLLEPFRDVKTGFFEGIGSVFGQSIGKGMQSSLEKMMGNSFNNAGKRFVDFAKINYQNDSFGKLASGNRSAYLQAGQTQTTVNQQQRVLAVGGQVSKPYQTESALRKTIETRLGEISKLQGSENDLLKAKTRFTEIKTAFKSAYEKFQESLNKGNLDLAKSYADVISRMSKVAAKEIDTTKAKLKAAGVPSQFGSEIATLAGSTKGVITSRYVNPSERNLNLANKLNNQSQQSIKIGSDVLAGVRVGLMQGKGATYSASAAIAEIMLKAMRDKLGIKSPATAFINMMKFVGQGIAVGLNQAKGLVTTAASALGDSVINPVKEKVTQGIKFATGQTFAQRRAQATAAKEPGSEAFFDRQLARFGNFITQGIKKGLG